MFTRVNSGDIANLSRIIKVFVIHSHDNFLDVARDMSLFINKVSSPW